MAMPRIFRRRWFWIVTILFLAVGGYVGFQIWDRYWPHSYTVTVSKETTVLLGPIDADGLVDYDAAIDAEMSKGVTPENNAAVLLIQILPANQRALISQAVLARLQVPAAEPCKEYTPFDESFFGSAPTELMPKASNGDSLESREEVARNQYSQSQQVPWTKADFPLLAMWIDKNQQALEVLREASRREKFLLPEEDSIISIFRICLKGQELLAIHSMLSAGEGDISEAIEDILAGRRLARLVSKNFTDIVALRMEDSCLQASSHIIAHFDLGPHARGLAEAANLDPLPPVTPAMSRKRYKALEAISRTAKFGMREAALAYQLDVDDRIKSWHVRRDWDDDLRKFNQGVERANRLAQKPDFRSAEQGLSAYRDELSKLVEVPGGDWFRFGRARQENMELLARLARHPAETLLHDSYVMHVENKLGLQYAVLARLEVNRVGLALDMFHSDNGRWPAKLEELVPKYLKRIPEDTFTGSDLIYMPSKEGYVLYSVGRNMTDDMGVESSSGRSSGDDIVIRHLPAEKNADTSKDK